MNPNLKLQVGQHLFTRDGREIGNAIVVEIHDSATGQLINIETDFGNPGQKLNVQEVQSLFYVTNADDDVVLSELDRWRDDRDQLRSPRMQSDFQGHAFEAALKTLNEAFEADPAATHALICNRVPCSQQMADHPTIQVGFNPTALPSYNVGMLGIINGIIEPITGQRIAVMFSDEDPLTKLSKVIGFTTYRPSSEIAG